MKKFSLTLVLTILFLKSVRGQLNEKINVGITFTKAANNDNLVNKFKLCVSSLLKYATIDINFYIIGDHESQNIAKKVFSRVKNAKINYEVIKFKHIINQSNLSVN